MPISRNLNKRIKALPTVKRNGLPHEVIEDFAILIEMRQDKDGQLIQFRHAFVRGDCAPIKVALSYDSMELVDDTNTRIDLVPDRQKFMTIEAWSKFVMEYIMSVGASPIINGTMPTRLLRDARKGYNYLQSFRQIVNHQYDRHKRAGTLVKP